RARDRDEVLEELQREIGVRALFFRELARHREHRLAVERHPRGRVGLDQLAAAGQRLAAIEHADVVEPEEPAAEQVIAAGILAIDPPREVDQALVERTLEELAVEAVPGLAG